MNNTRERSPRHDVMLCIVNAVLASLVSGFVLLDVAELQSVAQIIVHSQTQGTDRPWLDIGLVAISIGMAVPLVLLICGLLRRWPLGYFLGWIVAAVLAVFLVAAVAAFATYRYWRENQTVALIPTKSAPCAHPTDAADGRASLRRSA